MAKVTTEEKQALQKAGVWMRESGWKTECKDEATADKVYRQWIDATNLEWITTRNRDRELLSAALEAQFRATHDEYSVSCLLTIFRLRLEIRGLEEGVLGLKRVH